MKNSSSIFAIISLVFLLCVGNNQFLWCEKDNDNNSIRTEKSVSVAKKQNKPQTNAADDN
jgi:hypothetical protein